MNKTIKISIVILFFLIPGIYWTYRIIQYENSLKEISQPFVSACKSEDGCIIIPEGWRDNKDNNYSKDRMLYSATQEEFTIRWHIATDVYLVAKGGKNIDLVIKQEME